METKISQLINFYFLYKNMSVEKIIGMDSAIEKKRQERLENTKKVFDYLNVKEGEKFLFITDNNPYYTDREFIDLLKQELTARQIEFDEFVADDKKTKEKDLFKAVDGYQVVWNSWGMEETEIDFDKLVDAVIKKGGRMAYCPGLKAENLNNDGALAEDKAELDYRLARMETRLKGVAGFHIRSSYGTDLLVPLKKGELRWHKSDGEIKPGSWDNLPGGEIFTTPDEEGANGVLVLPVLSEEISRHQGVDEFVHLTIRGGKIAKIDGGRSAEKLRRYLEKNSKFEENPLSVLQCSEIAFGANSKASAAVAKPEGSYRSKGNPVVETEKRLGTMHVAFGDSRHGEEGTEGHTEADIHLDFVLPRNGLTVKAFYSQEDFKKGKNGERLIDEGRWRFVE